MLATLIRLAIGVGHPRKVCWLLSSRNSILLRGVFCNESRMRKIVMKKLLLSLLLVLFVVVDAQALTTAKGGFNVLPEPLPESAGQLI